MDLSLHLVSDLDGTWIPTEDDIPGLRALEGYLTGFAGLTLTFATGRTLHSATTELSDIVRLWPNHFVTDVGTAIYHRTSKGKWLEDAEYARRIDSRWDPDAAERVCRSLPEGIRRQPGLRARRRLALEVLSGVDLYRAAEALVHHLSKSWFAADVLPSNQRCLDVLPKGVNKGAAIEYLEKYIQLPSLLMVCGDSENDLDMFRLADLAVLMADSPLAEETIDIPGLRLIRPKARGPAGILEVLSSLASRDWTDRTLERRTSPLQARGTGDTGGAR